MPRCILFTMYVFYDTGWTLILVARFMLTLSKQIKLVDPSHEWKHEGFFFVYQSDMPMILSRKK